MAKDRLDPANGEETRVARAAWGKTVAEEEKEAEEGEAKERVEEACAIEGEGAGSEKGKDREVLRLR